MPKWACALLISMAATGLAAVAMNVLPGWKNPDRYRAVEKGTTKRSREDVIDAMSESEKDEMLRELSQYV